MTMIFDKSEKKIISGPLRIADHAPVTKYRAESDGRTFWAYNGMEVFYPDERQYDLFDEIERLGDNAVVDEANYMAALDRIAKLEGVIMGMECEGADWCGTSPHGTPGKRGYDNGKCEICNAQAALQEVSDEHRMEW